MSGRTLGYLVEFEAEGDLLRAAARVRDAGHARWDAHTPYPVHGLDRAMGVQPTGLPWLVLAGGLTGCGLGLLLQLYAGGVELPFSVADSALLDPFVQSGYPVVASAKPAFSLPAYVPVAFELTILCAALAAFAALWGLSGLPRLWHPVFTSPRFRRATSDRFFISLEVDDPPRDAAPARALAESLGGVHVEELREEEVS